MSKLLTPEELAEIKRLQLSDKFADEAERYYNDHVPDLLNHIEALNAVIAVRDQWAAQLTEQYAAREVLFKWALQEMIRPSDDTSTDYASRMRDLYHNQEVRIAAARLNITLD